MPLNWRLTEITDYEKICWEPHPDDTSRKRLKRYRDTHLGNNPGWHKPDHAQQL